MTLSESTIMATDTTLPENHTHESKGEQLDDFTGQEQEQSDDPTQQDKLRQRTLALIKPDAVQANHQQAIIDKIVSAGFTIIQQKQVQFTLVQACLFYREHENKPFYDQLTVWMSSAPIYAMVLEKENAIQDWRSLMGPTNAIKAREIDPTSIRALFGTDGSQNATHGSDCLTSAEREIDIVFGSLQNPSSSTDDNVVQSDLSTADTSFTPATDHDDSGSLLDDNISNKDQPLSTSKETDRSNDGLSNEATTATDDAAPFVPPTTAASLDTSNDVEHPVITSDSLSHPASADHDDAKNNNDAPTCPKSGFMEPTSGDDQSAAVTTANSLQEEKHVESAVTKYDVQEPLPQTNTDNKELTHVNSNTDETLEQHGSQNDTECNHHDSLAAETSLSDQQHQHQQQQQEQSSPVTVDTIAQDLGVNQSTSDDISKALEQSGGKDQVDSQVSTVVEKTDGQEKDADKDSPALNTTEESTTKAPETTITTISAADVNTTETKDHGADSTVNNSTANDNNTGTIEETTIEKVDQHIEQDHKLVDDIDDHDLTAEQETESLSIQEASNDVATPNIDTNDIKDEKEDVDKTHQLIDTTSATASDNTKLTDSIPVETTTDKTLDDNQEVTKTQDTKDEQGTDTAGENNFDTIPLANDGGEEEPKEVVVVAPTTGELTEVLVEPSRSVAVLEPAAIPAEVIVEQKSGPADVVDGESQCASVPNNGNEEPESIEDSISEAAVAEKLESTQDFIANVAETDESESINETVPAIEQKSCKETVAADEHESTKETVPADESKETQESIPSDTVVDEIANIKEPNGDNEPQSSEISNLGGSVTNQLETTAADGESEVTKEHVKDDVVDEHSENIEEHTEAHQSPNTTEIEKENETSGMETPATEKSAITEPDTETEDKDENTTAPAATTIEHESKSVSSDDHQLVSDEDSQANESETATVDKGDSVSSQDEDSAVDNTKATKSDERSPKEKKVASTNPPSSIARSELRKSPTGIAKIPVKSTSPPATTAKKSPTSTTGNTKTTTTATRVRRPGATSATGSGSSATSTAGTGSGVKNVSPKSSTSPGRTPLPRVATLAKKPATKTTEESKTSTDAKPATTKKRSSVISRLTAPTAASANKRTSEATSSAPASAAKTTTASGNGTTTRTRVTSTSGRHPPGTSAPATRRLVSKVSPAAAAAATGTSATDKPATARRTSPSSTADKVPITARRSSPPSSTTVHNKTARSSTAAPLSSARVSSTTTKSPSTDPASTKRTSARRISPPTSTHLTSATKATTKVSKPATTSDKKNDANRKKSKTSGATATAIKKTTKDTTTNKSDSKEKNGEDAPAETTTHSDNEIAEQHGENAQADEDHTDNQEQQHHQEEVSSEGEQHDHDNTSEQPAVVETITIQQEEETTTATTDAEVSATITDSTAGATLNPTTTDSSNKRPRTPEMAQLRNKFENLQAPSTVAPTRSSNKQPSSAPHNIKDLISRFN